MIITFLSIHYVFNDFILFVIVFENTKIQFEINNNLCTTGLINKPLDKRLVNR